MFPFDTVLSRRYCRPHISWLVWGCLGLAALLTAPPSAQAQTVYVLAHGPAVAGGGLQQYLTVVEGATNRKGLRIQLGVSSFNAYGLALAPDGKRVYAINSFDMTVSVVSTATNAVIQTLPKSLFGGDDILSGGFLTAVDVSPDSQRLYVAGVGGISVTDTTSMTSVNSRHDVAGRLVVSPDGTRLYVRQPGGQLVPGGPIEPDRVLVLDSTSLVTLADVSLPPPNNGSVLGGPRISVSSDGRFVYLTRGRQSGGSGLAVLDTTTNTIIHERPTPNAYAVDAQTSPNGAYLYVVGNNATDQLYRLSPTTHLELSTTSGVGNSYDVAFSADSARAYVAAEGRVYVIDTATHSIAATIGFLVADGSPRAVAVLGANPIGPTPSNLRATAIDGNRVTLVWNQPASGPALEYVIEGGLTPGSVLGSMRTGSAATSFTFDAPTGAFFVRVHAITSSGMSAASNEIQIVVNVPRPPSAPADLRGLANGSVVELSWQNTSGGGAATGLILDVSGDRTTSIPLPLAEAFTASGVPPGTYTLAIRAVNATGTSPASAPVTLTVPGACPGPPQTPRNVVVQRAGSLVSVTWDPPSAGPAVTNYVLNVTGAVNAALPLSTRRVAANVSSGTYNLSVAAVNACGSGMGTVPQSISVP